MKKIKVICPHCEGELLFSEEEAKKLLPGEATICPFCLEISIFETTSTLRKPSPDELWKLCDRAEVKKFLKTAKTYAWLIGKLTRAHQIMTWLLWGR